MSQSRHGKRDLKYQTTFDKSFQCKLNGLIQYYYFANSGNVDFYSMVEPSL